MSVHRIHIPAARIANGGAALERDELNYLLNVLRLGNGARVVVFDGEGHEYEAMLAAHGRRTQARLVIGRQRPVAAARGPEITLIQALIRNKNFDLVVRKAAELGAARLVPVITDRTVKVGRAAGERRRTGHEGYLVPSSAGASRAGFPLPRSMQREDGGEVRAAIPRTINRWRTIAAEASRQCRRADLMAVDEVADLGAALEASRAALKLIAWEGDGGVPLRDALERLDPGSVAVAVGPEGGFTDGEIEAAKAAGFTPVTLGTYILRAETAPLALLAAIQYALGGFGGGSGQKF